MQADKAVPHRAMLVLVIAMGVLILAGTATLIGVVVHRLAAGHRPVPIAGPVLGAAPGVAALHQEPPGTRITAMTRQSDTLLAIALSGGGPDRVLVWDLAAARSVTEITLAPEAP